MMGTVMQKFPNLRNIFDLNWKITILYQLNRDYDVRSGCSSVVTVASCVYDKCGSVWNN